MTRLGELTALRDVAQVAATGAATETQTETLAETLTEAKQLNTQLEPRAHAPPTHAPSPRPRNGENVLSLPVLVLNRYFAPVCLTTVRRGIVLLYGGAAHGVDESGELLSFNDWQRLELRPTDDVISTVGGGVRAPRVLHLTRYERTPGLEVRLTRRNLLLRDGHSCQYCGSRPPLRDLNVDHVLPRSRGGPDSWENLVISCRRCNLVKGQRTPSEAGMQLRAKPRRPRWSKTKHILLSAAQPYAEWAPFLQAG